MNQTPTTTLFCPAACFAGRFTSPDVRLQGGQVHHVIGPNGAGKSSWLSLLAGLVPDTLLQYQYTEQVLSSDADMWHEVRGLFTAHEHSVFDITVAEVFAFFVTSPDGQPTQIRPELDTLFDVAALWQRSVLSLSTGQRQRVYLARLCQHLYPALNEGRAVLLLDEACTGLDIRFAQALRQQLQRWAKAGNIIVHAHHDLHTIDPHSNDLVYVIDKGQIALSGRAHELDWAAIFPQYFGVSAP
jgi:ABC-type cobalamin transport system ATPase subunit